MCKEETVGERIRRIRTDKHMSQAEFASYLGIGQSALSILEKGMRNLTDRNIALICEQFKVRETWLRTGEGAVYMRTDDSVVGRLCREFRLDAVDRQMIEAYLSLSGEERSVIKKYIHSIALAMETESAATRMDPDEEALEAEVAAYRAELLAEKKARLVSGNGEVIAKRRKRA